MEQQEVFSLYDVSLHSSEQDCWLAINGKVYDVTKFLEEHPGGVDVLIGAADLQWGPLIIDVDLLDQKINGRFYHAKERGLLIYLDEKWTPADPTGVFQPNKQYIVGRGDATDAFEEVGHSSTATSMMNSYLIGVLDGSDSGYVYGSSQSLKTKEEERNSSAFTSFLDFIMPFLIIGIAYAAWYSYYYNKDNKS